MSVWNSFVIRNKFIGPFLKKACIKLSFSIIFWALCSMQLWSQVTITTVEPTSLTTCGDAQSFEMIISNSSNATLNGVSLTIDLAEGMVYETGSIVGMNVAESNVANLNEPIFILPNLMPANNLNITFLGKASCETANNIGDFINNFSINHSTGMDNASSSAYNIQVPSISITNTVNGLVSGTVGTAFTRSFTISNFGFGGVSALFFQDVHPAGVAVTGSDFGILNLNGNTATITLSEIDFNQIGNGDGTLDFGESITLTENFVLISCEDGLSEISVGWGCDGDICETFMDFVEVIVEAESPFLEWSYGAVTYASLCESGSLEILIFNNITENFPGAAAAYNLSLETGMGATNEPDSLLRIPCFDLSNFSIGNSNIVSDTNDFAGYGLLLNQFAFDPDGVGGLEDLDNDGQFDDLAAGDTVRLFLNAGLDFTCLDCAIEVLPIHTFRFAQSFNSQCGEDFYQKDNNDFYTHRIGGKSVSDNLEFEYENGDTIFLEFAFKRAFEGFQLACSDDSVSVSLTIPDGVTFQPIPAPTYNEELVDYDLTGNVLMITGSNFKGKLTATFTTECDSSNFDFSLPCANANDIPSILSFDYSIDYQCYSDTCSEPVNLYCGRTSPFFISCLSPTDSEILGIVTDTFFADRVTMGWTDENLTQLVNPNDPNVRIKHGMSNDVLRLEVLGTVIGSAEVDNSFLRIFHLPLTEKKYFTYLSDTISFYDHETEQTIVCAGLEIPVIDNLYSGLFKMDIDLKERFSTGCFSGLHLTEGDTISFSIYVKLTDVNLPNSFSKIPNFTAGFVFEYESEELICKRKKAGFKVLRTLNNLVVNAPSVINQCNQITIGNNLQQGSNLPDVDVFPFEYRPSERYDSVIFELPLGLNYLAGSAALTFEYRLGNTDIEPFETETVPIPDPEIYREGTILFLKFVNEDIYPIVDLLKKNVRYEIIFDLSYDCRLTPTSQIKANNYFERYIYSTNLPSAVFIADSKVKTLTYQPPNRAFGAEQQTFETLSNDVLWTFDLCNTPNAQAVGEAVPNNWITFEINETNIEITGLSEVTNPAIPIPMTLDTYGSSGKFWSKIGTIDSLTCRSFQLDATFENCSIDTVNMRSGFNCTGYPVDPDVGYEVLEGNDVLGDYYDCGIPELTEQLLLLPRNPDFQISLVNAPTGLSDLCQSLAYEFRILNTQIGPAFELEIEVNLPPGEGTTLLFGTSEFKYPIDQPYQNLPEPTNIPGTNRYVWNLSDLDPSLAALGLVGSDKSPENEVLIRFQLLTNCDYLDGFVPQLTARGISICNEINESVPFAFPPLLLNGFVAENNYLMNMNVSAIQPCGAPSTVWLSAGNIGTADSNSGQGIVVIMDANFDYVPNSITDIQNFPTPIEPSNTLVDTVRILEWDFPEGLSANAFLQLSFEVKTVNPALLSCGTTDLIAQIKQLTTIDCVTEPQGFCEINVVLEQRQFSTPVVFPDFVFNTASATAIPIDNANEVVTFDFEITNVSDLDYADSLVVSVYQDLNGNGELEENIDGLLMHHFLSDTTILVGNAASFQFETNLPNSALCQLMLVLATDENACLCETQAIPVPFVQLENTIQNDTLCLHESVVLGLSLADDYIYEWQPAGAFVANISNPTYLFTGTLPAESFITESFILTTTRLGGCMSSDTVEITTIQNNVDLEVSDYNGSDISCFGANDAFINSTIEVLLGDFTVEWNTGDTISMLNNLPPGMYEIKVTDNQNCQSIESVLIEEPAEVDGEIEITTEYFGFDVQCFEGENGAVELLAIGGTGALTFAWSNGSTESILTNISAGNYEVTITDLNACSDTEIVYLTEPLPIVLSVQTVDNLCFGDKEGIIEIIDAEPESTYQFGLDCNNFSTNTFFPNLAASDYIICVQTTTDCIYENEISIEQPPELTVEIIQDTVVFLGESALLFAETSYPIDSLIWSPRAYLNCMNCLEVEASVLENTVFTVTVFDLNDCEAKDAALVGINKKPRIFVPNVFSPNGDGMNDFLLIFADSGVEEIAEFKIFSRWGSLIFEQNNFQPNDPVYGWDGVFQSKKMDASVFVWFLKATLIDGSEVLLKGDFTLLR
ncbi:MAG: gliding motility-associated-like protein [Saprospiraceae bacterium]|jgi:gliding motility-associated-like protein